jgi:starvation-inducible DNA-binding protein
MTPLHTFTTRNDVPSELRDTMTTLLNQRLADTFDLYTQVKQAHWNVKGMQFIQLHRFFDELAQTLNEFVDEIAERITALGGTALGTARITAAQSQLPEFPTEIVAGKQVVEVLTQRYGSYSSSTRDATDKAAEYGDPTTADLFTQISREIDKQLWMLEAHLQS